MSTDIHQLRRQNSERAIIGGESLVELRHLAADTGQSLHQMNFKAHFGEIQRGLYAGDAAADNKYILTLHFVILLCPIGSFPGHGCLQVMQQKTVQIDYAHTDIRVALRADQVNPAFGTCGEQSLCPGRDCLLQPLYLHALGPIGAFHPGTGAAA
jgi:hypothetical protein